MMISWDGCTLSASLLVVFIIFPTIAALLPIMLIQKSGAEAAGGAVLLICDLIIARYAGRFALRVQRDTMPECLAGFGMIIAAIYSCGIFNLSCVYLVRHFG